MTATATKPQHSSTVTTAHYVARQAFAYTDETATMLRQEMAEIRTQMRAEDDMNTGQSAKIKFAIHVTMILAGIILTATLVHFNVNTYVSAACAAIPVMVQEACDFAKRL
jgi:hypothetical protein